MKSIFSVAALSLMLLLCLKQIFVECKTCDTLIEEDESLDDFCHREIFKLVAKFQETCKAHDFASVCDNEEDNNCWKWVLRNVYNERGGIDELRVLTSLVNKMESVTVSGCINIISSDECDKTFRLKSLICEELKKKVCDPLPSNEAEASCKLWMTNHQCPSNEI